MEDGVTVVKTEAESGSPEVKVVSHTNENEMLRSKTKPGDEAENNAIKREDNSSIVEKREEVPMVTNAPSLKKKSPSQQPRPKTSMANGERIPTLSNKHPPGRFNHMNHPPSLPGPRGPFPMGRYGAPPPYGFPNAGSYHGPPHPHAYPPPHMMQHFNMTNNGQFSMKANFHPAMAAAYGGGSAGPYGIPAPYPPQHPMNSNFSHSQMNTSSDSNSISSMSSHNSKKKRTIDGMHPNNNSMGFNPYAFRRSEDSNSSTTSTMTNGNNTSTDLMDEDTKNSSSNASMVFRPKNVRPESRLHRRTGSGSSTASSLSVGGCSLSSYGEKGKRVCDRIESDGFLTVSSSRS